jgi:hypothetical protein
MVPGRVARGFALAWAAAPPHVSASAAMTDATATAGRAVLSILVIGTYLHLPRPWLSRTPRVVCTVSSRKVHELLATDGSHRKFEETRAPGRSDRLAALDELSGDDRAMLLSFLDALVTRTRLKRLTADIS